MSTSAALLPIVLIVGSHRVDIAVTGSARLSDVLHSSGVDPAQASVTSSTGVVLDLQELVAAQVRSGEVLWVVDRQAASRRTQDAGRSAARGRQRVGAEAAGWLVCALVTALCLVVVASHAWLMGAADAADPVLWRTGVAIALGVAAIALAARTRAERPGTSNSSLVDETVLAPVLAFTAAFLLADPQIYGAPSLGVVLGLIAGTAAATLRYAMARRSQDPSEAVAGVMAALWAVLAGIFALALLFDLPAYTAPALMLGSAPVIMRVMPSAALGIADEQLLDLPYLSRTAASVRGVQARPPGRVRVATVKDQVRFAERRRGAGLLIASALVVVLSPSVISSYTPGGFRGWGTVALISLLVVFLALAPRTFRRREEKAVPRLALLAVLVQLAWLAHSEPQLQMWALVVIGCAVAMAFLAIPLARGYRSVRWSRLGDLAEGIAVVFIMPAALFAAGAYEGLQTLTA